VRFQIRTFCQFCELVSRGEMPDHLQFKVFRHVASLEVRLQIMFRALNRSKRDTRNRVRIEGDMSAG